jgi:hypothetical protein
MEAGIEMLSNEEMRLNNLSKVLVLTTGEAELDLDLSDSRASILHHHTDLFYILKSEDTHPSWHKEELRQQD